MLLLLVFGGDFVTISLKSLRNGQFMMYRGFAIIRFGSSYTFTDKILYGFPQFTGKEEWYNTGYEVRIVIDSFLNPVSPSINRGIVRVSTG